jgi:hypothetical protein
VRPDKLLPDSRGRTLAIGTLVLAFAFTEGVANALAGAA